jgi:hypothetical protein
MFIEHALIQFAKRWLTRKDKEKVEEYRQCMPFWITTNLLPFLRKYYPADEATLMEDIRKSYEMAQVLVCSHLPLTAFLNFRSCRQQCLTYSDSIPYPTNRTTSTPSWTSLPASSTKIANSGTLSRPATMRNLGSLSPWF